MRVSLLSLCLVLAACSGHSSSESETPPPSTGAPPSSVAPPPSTGPTVAEQRVDLLEQYEQCHATLRDQREARSRDHRHIARLTVERDAAQATVAHAHGAALTTAQATLADLQEDLHEAQGRYDAERGSVRVSEDSCNRIQDQIHALPR
jgi:hypothetical protein